MAEIDGLWQGASVVCIASGPSVTPDDVERIRQWRFSVAARRVVVTNSMVFWAPWADAVFGMDSAWWRQYQHQLPAEFTGLRLTSAKHVKDVTTLKLPVTGNSGLASLMAAKTLGAERICMVGFDAARGEGGKAHCHGDHPKPLTNAKSVSKWPDQFARARHHFDGIDVINASRRTLITVWPQQPLEEALAA